jgi:hypothetical protein
MSIVQDVSWIHITNVAGDTYRSPAWSWARASWATSVSGSAAASAGVNQAAALVDPP